jgi:tRNA threonylcarbamoyladenosine biosynthesis protein TsaE
METKIFVSKNAAETQAFARQIIDSFLDEQRDAALVLALEGELGGGKTTFVQGLADLLDLDGPITSPTFVIMKRYAIKNPKLNKIFKNFYHADCYRLESAGELSVLGFDKIIKDPENLLIVEWADKAREIIPRNAVWIKFEFINEEERKIEISK